MRFADRPRRGFSFHVATSTIANFSVPLAALATAPILARELGTAGRGELAAATAPLLLLSAIAMLGLPESVTFYAARYPRAARSIRTRVALTLAASGALSFLLTCLLAQYLAAGDPQLAAMIVLGTMAIVPSTVLGALRGVAAARHQWSRVNAEKYITSFLKFALIVGLALSSNLDVISAIIAIAFAPLAGYLPYLLRTKDETGIGQVAEHATVPYRALLSYGMAIWIGSLSGVVLTRIDQLLMVPLTGSAVQLGFYAAAVNVGDVALLANNAVRDVTFTSEAKGGSDDRLHTAARLSFAVSLVVGIVLIASMPAWFSLLFGAAFADALPVAQILVAASVLGVPGSVGGAGLSARGKPGLRSLSLVLAALVNVVLLVLLLPSLGAFGAGIATLVGNLIAANLNLVFLRVKFGTPIVPFYAVSHRDFWTAAKLASSLLRRGR